MDLAVWQMMTQQTNYLFVFLRLLFLRWAGSQSIPYSWR